MEEDSLMGSPQISICGESGGNGRTYDLAERYRSCDPFAEFDRANRRGNMEETVECEKGDPKGRPSFTHSQIHTKLCQKCYSKNKRERIVYMIIISQICHFVLRFGKI